MNIPSWLDNRINISDAKIIEEAIRKAELKTSAELVPLVVRRSSTIGHIPLTLILLFTSFWFLSAWMLSFSEQLPHYLELPWVNVLIFILILALTRLLSPLEWVERILTPRRDQTLQVRNRAKLEFYNANITRTKDFTGILIMISLMEHQAVVLADQSIADKLPENTWNEVVAEIIKGIKNKNISAGLIQGLEVCGELLKKDFPIASDDTNELPNHLLIKE